MPLFSIDNESLCWTMNFRQHLPINKCQIFLLQSMLKDQNVHNRGLESATFLLQVSHFPDSMVHTFKGDLSTEKIKISFPLVRCFLHNLILTLLECVTGQMILIYNFPTLLNFLQTIVQ